MMISQLMALLALWPIGQAIGQVIVEDRPPVMVTVEQTQAAAVKLMQPHEGMVVSDSLLRIEGFIVPRGFRGMVHLRLADVEQLIATGANGHFVAALPLRSIGRHQLTVEAGGPSSRVNVVYRPTIVSLAIACPQRGSVLPGESIQLEAIGALQSGVLRAVSPAVSWRSSDPAIGRVDAGGRFVALSVGRTVVSAIYGVTTATVPLKVVTEEPPAPSPGMTNLTVRTPRITLRVLDHADEDGDIISVFLNDKPVVESIEIFHKPQDVTVILAPGLNTVEIRAENEGRDPPNTASIWVVTPDGQVEQRFKANQHIRERFAITLK